MNIYQGFHSKEIAELVSQSWSHDQTLLIGTPQQEFGPYITQIEKTEFKEKPIFGVFTSGTSGGIPRLVLYSKNNILNSLNSILGLFDSQKIDGIFSYPQPTHTFGLLLGYVLSHVLRVPLYFREGKYGRGAHELRQEVQSPGLLTLGTPTHFYDLLEWTKTMRATLAPSYSCIVGGSPCSVSLWNNLRAKLNIEAPSVGYGCTEASPGISHLPPGIEPSTDGDIGFLLGALESKITDSHVEISGPSLAMALVSENGVMFPPSVLIRDQLVKNSDNRLVYLGRTDFVLNRGGAKYYLEAIENMLRIKLNLSAIAYVVEHERLGQDLGLLLEGQVIINRQLVALARSCIQEQFQFLIPNENIAVIERLPLNSSGKYDRHSPLLAKSNKANTLSRLEADL